MPAGPHDISEDALLNGRVRLLQPRRGHRVGTDAVLVAAAVQPAQGETVVDLGAGVGAVGLMIGARADVAVVFVERDPDLAELCRRNIALNGLTRGEVVEADVLAPARERRRAGLTREVADVVVTNPPFHAEGRSRASHDPGRAAAHQLPQGGLERWIRTGADLLKPKGRLVLIHRADRLGDCLQHLGRGFGAITLIAVHPRVEEPASRILLTGVKGSRAPCEIAPPLVLHDADGRFTPEAEALHRGEALRGQGGRRASAPASE